MIRSLRRLVGVAAIAALASAALVASASAPAPAAAETTGYTVQSLVPNGVGAQRCRLATIDLVTGVVSPIGDAQPGTLACANDLAFSPGGALYGVSEVWEDDGEVDAPSVDDSTTSTTGAAAPAELVPFVHLIRFDTTTGAVTDLGRIGTTSASLNSRGGGVTFDSSGALYVYMVADDEECDGSALCLYQVDPANPTAVAYLGNDPVKTALTGLTAACGQSMYTMEEFEERGTSITGDAYTYYGGNQLDVVNPVPPATATAVGDAFADTRTVQSIDFGSDGTLWALGTGPQAGLSGLTELSTLDPATGAQTPGPPVTVAGAEDNSLVIGLAVAPPRCPEPPAIQPTFTG